MNQIVLSTHMWISLPNEVRWKLRRVFGIPQSSNVVVNDGKLETDGTTPEDFKYLTVEKMQKYLSDDSTDFHKLFDSSVAKITEELYGAKGVQETIEVSSTEAVTVVIEPKKTRGRPKKNT